MEAVTPMVSAAPTAAPAAPVAVPPPQIIVVEVLDHHGRVQQRHRVALTSERRRFTAGRSAAADVMLDDAYCAPLHAGFDITSDGRILIEDLDSLNGIVVDGRRLHGVKTLALSAGVVQIGRSTLRVRFGREALAPERPDHSASNGRSMAQLAIAALAFCVLFVIYFAWLSAPRDLATAAAGALTTTLAASAGWVAIWALLSRVMQGEWRVETHAAILFCVAAGMLIIDSLRDVIWFALALPLGGVLDLLLGMVAVAVLLYFHLTHASNLKPRTAALGAILLPALIGGIGAWVQARNLERNVNHIAVREQVYPPALRLRAAGSVEQYFAAGAKLKEEADKKRRAIPVDDGDDAGEE